MSEKREVQVPDIGDFDKVPVIEILVAEGDEVEAEQSLITLESDKATMEVPAPAAGRILELRVKEGDEVSKGDVIALMEAAESETASSAAGSASSEAGSPRQDGSDQAATTASPRREAEAPTRPAQTDFDLVVLGAGPGGYTAAFRAADLGLKVALVERYESLGGVCLNVGCIPSKALLHVGQIIDAADHLGSHGVKFGAPEIDLDALRGYKNEVVGKLTGGLAGMAKKRKVEVIHGRAEFAAAHSLAVESEDGRRELSFAQCIIAAGSRVVRIPGIPWDDERVMDSTDALELAEVPERLLVIGGGIIGLEMACVHRALGSKVTVVELMDQLMPGADADLVKPLQQHMQKLGVEFHLETKVEQVEATEQALVAHLAGKGAPERAEFDRVLVSVGRRPNGDRINAGAAGVDVDERGFIPVDGQMRTGQSHIFAIGDIIGQPMLAHKASYEGKIAAEVAAGHKRAADARVIPSVAYTDPEVAWVGLTEAQAKDKGIDYGVGKFPWAASGRALGMDRSEGFTKLIFSKENDRLIGAGVVGLHAGDLIAELALAIEMGCSAEDIGLTIHPHPTLSESVMMAAEVYEGTITDLYLPKR
ncbi:dihydrolipoyl dehydrogenase [Wenzhouxiangella marina]|uniref:Dihydrolipoyl dehydrogenase n=1 Tax=Wenzhouxiangella marina TaxID=1579979 RepID=A0A0K0XZC4_9GAMM|nr:dihydrolipoyl dehydrogenase [Wenzhouxiangella marina]AKS42971.1 dihydrolipoamide dehydrogenase [Wenzhouxiangella marina]MBB6087345.1 dihydrolipoamide dehydrogenase [Wenzhouxiangella marina]